MFEKYYKINLHLLEPCNYHCKYCFAHFDSKTILTVNQWEKIIDKCIDNIVYPVNHFNLAGGEPLMYKDIDKLIRYIYLEKNKKVSIITNGYLLTDDFIIKNVKYLDTIGISIDSFNKKILIDSGRCTSNNNFLSFDKFKHFYKLIKQNNHKCKIKINTVVSQYNKKDCSVVEKIKSTPEICIDRWKILKIDLFKNKIFDNSSITISDSEFDEFIYKNINLLNAESDEICSKKFKNVVFENKLSGGYIIIDANGFLVDDTLNNSYTKILNCLDDDDMNFSLGFKRLNLDTNLYYSRYKHNTNKSN